MESSFLEELDQRISAMSCRGWGSIALTIFYTCFLTVNAVDEDVIVFANRTHLHWTIEGRMHHIIPLNNISGAKYIDFDPVENKLYWSDVLEGGSISRSTLCGCEQEVVVSNIFVRRVKATFVSIAVDIVHRTIFWTNSAIDRLERTSLDGKNRTIIAQYNMGSPIDVEVDPYARVIYWLDAGIKPKIESCELDGGSRVVLIDLSKQYPSSLALDIETQTLYWNDKNEKFLYMANSDGSSMRVLKMQIPHITGLFVKGDFIYWVDWWNKDIEKTSRVGNGSATAVLSQISDIEDIIGITVDSKFVQCSPKSAYNLRASSKIDNKTVVTTLRWKPGYNWKIPQTFYLELQDYEDIWINVHSNRDVISSEEVNAVVDLRPNRDYRFRVRSCNKYGCSKSSLPEIQIVTPNVVKPKKDPKPFDGIAVLLKTLIIVGAVIIFVACCLAFYGFWKSRQRKSRHHNVRYSMTSYST